MRSRSSLTALAASLALLAGAAPASAARLPVPASPAAYAAAQAVAVAHWGADPCGGKVAVAWTSMDRTINAVATWSNPVSLFGNASANYNCSITYNVRQPWSWPMFCTITEHELGHLAGQQHSDDPNDVMSPYYTGPSADCLAAPDPVASPTAINAESRTAARARARARARHAGAHAARHNGRAARALRYFRFA